MTSTITVLKFGGSVLRCEEDLPKAVHEIYRHWRRGSQVLAVVSAFGGTTDALIEKSKAFGDDPHPEALASLLFTGEATSAALLVLALKRAGIPAKILNPDQVGLRTIGPALDSEPIDANVERLRTELNEAVVIVSGFAGINRNGDLTLLGRGGTDLTALFIAEKLAARCILLKDVGGMYESNPSDVRVTPRRFLKASYETTLRVSDELVQTKAVHFASNHNQQFEIRAIGSGSGTIIGNVDDELSTNGIESRPLRVALLGCGTVGGGVYHRLSALPEHFKVTGVVNLDPEKAIANGVRAEQIERDARKLIEQDCDVVVELIGGIEPAWSLIDHALRLKRHVVTANKALIAEHGRSLEVFAQKVGVSLHYSASVGGSMPALETVTSVGRSARIRSVSGIINGTCNYICDQLAKGVDFATALNTAQIEGYAEADPTLDLDGTDAAQKLILLARAAFGVDLPLTKIERKGINTLSQQDINEATRHERVHRLVAVCGPAPDGLRAKVEPVQVPTDHPFALTKGTENCLYIETEAGSTRLTRGRGAGRHATTESVIADLFDVRDAVYTSSTNEQYRRSAA